MSSEKGNSNFNFFSALLLFGLAAVFLAVYMMRSPSVELTVTEVMTLIHDGEVVIEVEESPLVLPLLPRGTVPFRIGTARPGGWTIHQSVELGENAVVVPIIR